MVSRLVDDASCKLTVTRGKRGELQLPATGTCKVGTNVHVDNSKHKGTKLLTLFNSTKLGRTNVRPQSSVWGVFASGQESSDRDSRERLSNEGAIQQPRSLYVEQ